MDLHPFWTDLKSWYSIQAKADQKTADISIYDEIGYWGVTAKQFIGDLKALDATTIKLAINSPGGAVFDALAIYNALRQHPAAVEVTIMGVAASAASVIAMAGDTIVMPENAFMMIHNPLNLAYGNADDLREMADVLDKIGASLIGIYAKRTGMPEDEIKALLDAYNPTGSSAHVRFNTSKTDRLTFAIGCGIAGVAGAAFTTIGSTGPTSGSLYIVDSFLVVTFGGAASLLGTVASAFGIAQTQSISEFFMTGSNAKVLTLMVVITILMMRPQGLFAAKVRR